KEKGKPCGDEQDDQRQQPEHGEVIQLDSLAFAAQLVIFVRLASNFLRRSHNIQGKAACTNDGTLPCAVRPHHWAGRDEQLELGCRVSADDSLRGNPVELGKLLQDLLQVRQTLPGFTKHSASFVEVDCPLHSQFRDLSRQAGGHGRFFASGCGPFDLLAGGQMFGRFERPLFGLGLKLLNNLPGVAPHDVERNTKPPVEAAVDQAISKDEEDADRHQRDTEKGHHHLRLEPGTELLLAALDVKLQQNPQKDESEDDKCQKDDCRQNQ